MVELSDPARGTIELVAEWRLICFNSDKKRQTETVSQYTLLFSFS